MSLGHLPSNCDNLKVDTLEFPKGLNALAAGDVRNVTVRPRTLR